MAKMPSASQNTIYIGAEKINILIVNPRGKGKGMLKGQKMSKKEHPLKIFWFKQVLEIPKCQILFI